MLHSSEFFFQFFFFILYYDQQMHNYLTKFRHYRVILREPVINTLPSYASIANAAVGNAI